MLIKNKKRKKEQNFADFWSTDAFLLVSARRAEQKQQLYSNNNKVSN